MTSAMTMYLALNQLLLGKKIKELPLEARQFLEDNNLVQPYDRALKVKRLVVTPLEKLFINLLRTPDYTFNMPNADKAPLSLEQVVKVVRDNNYAPDTCAHWAIYLISDVTDSFNGKDYIQDSVLSLTPQTMGSGVDLTDCMKRAFAIRCWGVLNPTEKGMRAFREVSDFVALQGEMAMTVKKFEKLLKGFVTCQISPRDVGEYSLIVSDLAATLKVVHGLCCWDNVAHTLVRLIVPRGTADGTVVAGIIPTDDFMTLLGDNEDALRYARARGTEIVFSAPKETKGA